MYSPLNSYLYIHWILDFKYILLLLIKIPTFITALTDKLEKLKRENKYIFLLGDYNVDISPCIEFDMGTEEFKNTLSSYHFYLLLLISKPDKLNPQILL